MRKFFIISIATLAASFISFSFKTVLKEPVPPSGYSGAPTQSRTCVNCHGDFSLNSGGGNVVTTGLPTGFYVPGRVYNFSITISNATPMQIWGFAIKAVVSGTSGTALGTFSTTNPNAAVASSELKNNSAVLFDGTSYTYNNLTWTAPSTGSSLVSFYMTGIAGDADGSETGDFIYSNSILSIPIPITIGEITGKLVDHAAIIEWSTYSESGSKHFELERSTDGRNFQMINTVAGNGNSNTIRNYSTTDNDLPANEQTLYYRLKMVDLDGTFAYSKMILLKPALSVYISNLYPSSINRNEQVLLSMVSDKSRQAIISIYSSNGIKIQEQQAILTRGMNNININSLNLKYAGIYIIKVSSDQFNDTRRIIVQ